LWGFWLCDLLFVDLTVESALVRNDSSFSEVGDSETDDNHADGGIGDKSYGTNFGELEAGVVGGKRDVHEDLLSRGFTIALVFLAQKIKP
jgi:hypothetical protein